MTDWETELKTAFMHFMEAIVLVPTKEESWYGHNPIHTLLTSMLLTYRTHEEASEDHSMVVKTGDFQKFLLVLYRLFDGRIGQKSVQQFFISLFDDGTLLYPFTQDSKERCLEKFMGFVNYYNSEEIEALVPLFNFISYLYEEFQLADAVFSPGKSGSLLAIKSKVLDNQTFDYSRTSFLRIKVSGDPESRDNQVNEAVDNALCLLRFITTWETDNEQKYRNFASTVSRTRDKENLTIFYAPNRQKIDEIESWKSHYGDIFRLTPEMVNVGYEHYGLDDFNYHYANSDKFVSQRILRALEMYDEGTLSRRKDRAIYRYAVAIEIVLPENKSGKDIAKDLEKLLLYGNHFYLNTALEDKLKEPLDKGYPSMAYRQFSKTYEDFYKVRNGVLHGKETIEAGSAFIDSPFTGEKIPYSDVLFRDDEIQFLRYLAHNTVRIVAYLARAFGWKTYAELDAWFENPSKPPMTGDEVTDNSL